MALNCDVCKELICKYNMDFNASGGISIWVNHEQDEKLICEDCAKKIAKELIER